MIISLLVAMDEKRGIGKDGQLPWRLSSDLKRFRQLTMGHHIIVGRKTFESIGRPLPGRRNLVVTRSREIQGVEIVCDLEKFDPSFYEINGKDLFVIGGAEIYRALLPKCDTIYVTMLKQEFSGDTYFPAFETSFELSEVIRETSAYDVLRYLRI